MAKRTVHSWRRETCPVCNGEGVLPDMTECHRCQGSGQISVSLGKQQLDEFGKEAEAENDARLADAGLGGIDESGNGTPPPVV